MANPPAKAAQPPPAPPANVPQGSLRPRRAFLAGTVLAALVGVLAAWIWLRPSPERGQGLRLAAQGRFVAAEPLLRRALEDRPDDLALIQALARGELAVGRLNEAEPYLDRWCELQPQAAEPFKQRMELHLNTRRFAEALEDGQRVLELDPGDDAIHYEMARLYLLSGRYEDAERECRSCLQHDPRNPDLLYFLADACHGRGNCTAAGEVLDALLHDYPAMPRALLLRGTVFNETNQPQDAIPLLERAILLERRSSQRIAAYYQLSLALERTGRSQEARRAAAELEYEQALYHIGRALSELGEPREASRRAAPDGQADLLAEVLARDDLPPMAGLLFPLAESLAKRDRPTEAVHVLEKVVYQDPNYTAETLRVLEYILRQHPDCAPARQLRAACRTRGAAVPKTQSAAPSSPRAERGTP